MKLSEKIRKRLAVNMPITNDAPRVYAWIDELEQLETENERLREALAQIMEGRDSSDMYSIARDARKEGE